MQQQSEQGSESPKAVTMIENLHDEQSAAELTKQP
jgi:hypothetical protein